MRKISGARLTDAAKSIVPPARTRQPSCRTPKSRPNGQLDFAAAALHAFESLRQVDQTNLFRHEVVPENIAAANGFESFADETRRVMKRRNQFDLGIVDGRG